MVEDEEVDGRVADQEGQAAEEERGVEQFRDERGLGAHRDEGRDAGACVGGERRAEARVSLSLMRVSFR